MTDRPIIFSAPMIQALLAGRKTVTRRITDLKGLRWTVGDRLWVRENHRLTDCPCTEACRGSGHVFYEADLSGYTAVCRNRLRPSIHMPRWASRLTLVVTDVKVERLQDISERDAVREGLINNGDHTWPLWTAGEGFKEHIEFPIDAFRELWESINGPEAWNANPWVAAVSFKVQRANIDTLETGVAA